MMSKILLQSYFLVIFLRQKKMNKNLLFSHNLFNISPKLIWFTHANLLAINYHFLTWMLAQWRYLNSIKSPFSAQNQYQRLSLTQVNMLLILNSLMAVGSALNAKTITSKAAKLVIVVRNQNLMKIMMASLSTCSRLLKRKLLSKFKRIKLKS